MIRVPRPKVNRLGVYCLRVVWIDEAGKHRETSHSLRTKSTKIARVLALQPRRLIKNNPSIWS